MNEQVTSEPVLKVLGGFLAANYLFAANEMGVFAAIGSDTKTVEEIAALITAPPRTTRILVDALVATGFLQKENGRYQNSPVAATFLSGQTPMDLRPIINLWDKVVSPQWDTLVESLRENRQTFGLNEFNQQQHQFFAKGVATLTAPSAQALVQQYDFSAHQSVLDIAGGMGVFLTTILQQYPHLQGTLFELPVTANMARQRISALPIADRTHIAEGDILDDPVPTGHDAFILANAIHIFSPEKNQAILRKIHAAAPDNARLLLIDFWTDPAHIQPQFAALMAGEFQIFSGEGDVYSVQEVYDWLEACGWQPIGHHHLAGAASLISAQKA
ncbi:MAG: hypothetical protein KC443_02895 [Anaerolineales bacterium]|nr:hypothetical protein [Anaerolineales bacterium]